MSRCRVFSFGDLQTAIAAAKNSPRKRTNCNVHPHWGDSIQRFFNCLEPTAYIRPHRHAPGRFELFVLVQGSAGVLLFDNHGQVEEKHRLTPKHARAVEIPGEVFHTVVALAPETILFEVKPGPYEPLTDKHFAPWAPEEGGEASEKLVHQWQELFNPGPRGCT